MFFLSCNAIKELKDDRAIGRVLSNPTLTARVASVIPVEFKEVYIRGKDSIITRIDSVPVPSGVNIDSLADAIKNDCPTVNFDSLKRAWTKTIYVDNLRVDTFYTPNPDLYRRLLNAEVMVANFTGQLLQKDLDVKNLERKSRERTVWEIGIGVIVVGVFWVLFKRKKG